jgi:chromosome segregation ATPase
MLVREEDYLKLLKERQEAKDRGDSLAAHAKSLTAQLNQTQGDLVKTAIAKADVEAEYGNFKVACKRDIETLTTELVKVESESKKAKEERDEAQAKFKVHDEYIPILQATYEKSVSDLKEANDKLAIKTAEHKQMRDDLLEARKLLWGVPDALPRDAAEQVDWARMGLPDPLTEGVPK